MPIRLDSVLRGAVAGRNRRSTVGLALAALAGGRQKRLRISNCRGDEHLGNDCRDSVPVTTVLPVRLCRAGNPCREGFAVTTTKSTLC